MDRIPEFMVVPFDAHARKLAAVGRLVHGHGAAWDAWAPYVEQDASGVLQVDLGGVNDIDAAGLGLLARLTRFVRQRGRNICLVSAQPRVWQMITAARLETQIPVCALAGNGPGRSTFGREQRAGAPARCGQ